MIIAICQKNLPMKRLLRWPFMASHPMCMTPYEARHSYPLPCVNFIVQVGL